MRAASANDYSRGHRSSQAPLPCPGRARKRHALYPLYLVSFPFCSSVLTIVFLVHSCRTLACIAQYDPTLHKSEIAERQPKMGDLAWEIPR